MELNEAIKLMAITTIALLMCHFALSTVLSFIGRFSGQLQKFFKSMLIAAGVFYAIGLLALPGHTRALSQPLVQFAERIAPGFF